MTGSNWINHHHLEVRMAGKKLSVEPTIDPSAKLKDVKLGGLSMEEAGARSGMSGGAVRVSIHRGLQILMRKVRDENR